MEHSVTATPSARSPVSSEPRPPLARRLRARRGRGPTACARTGSTRVPRQLAASPCTAAKAPPPRTCENPASQVAKATTHPPDPQGGPPSAGLQVFRARLAIGGRASKAWSISTHRTSFARRRKDSQVSGIARRHATRGVPTPVRATFSRVVGSGHRADRGSEFPVRARSCSGGKIISWQGWPSPRGHPRAPPSTDGAAHQEAPGEALLIGGARAASGPCP